MADLTWVGDRGILVASDSGESLSPQPHRWNGGWDTDRAGFNLLCRILSAWGSLRVLAGRRALV